MPPESESPLERLNRRLYAPKPVEAVTPPPLRPAMPPPEASAPPPAWVAPAAPSVKPPHGWNAMPWTSRFLVLALGFFVLAGGVAALMFFGGARSISSENVEVGAHGPLSIGSGDTVAIVVTVRNDNPTTITNTNLIVDLPEGTREAVDKTKPYDHYTDTLGSLAPGEEASRTVNAVMFGAQNQLLTVPIRVEYRAENSNASFVTEGEYAVTITTSPLSLTVTAPREAASGEPFTLVATARSNAATHLENVGLEIVYPPGFIASETSPRPSSGTLFDLGSFTPGEQKSVTVKGALSGQASDERVFRLTAGTRATSDATSIALPYASADAAITVGRPFLGTSLSLNRDTNDTVLVPPGESVGGLLSWQNNLAVPVSDARIAVKFSGNGFDPAQVYTQSGYYRSSDSTILFSKDTNQDLAQLLPGDMGTGSFSFTPKSSGALQGVPNPTVTITVSIAGNRVGENRVPETISSTVTKTVKVGTSVTYEARTLRRSGPFTNTGPVPPRPDTETTYTVELSATNSVNSIGGAQASMTLPSYVRFTGAVSPSGSVLYDERTRTVVWKVNDLAPGASTKAYFQVALLPSASQKGISPVLVSEQTFTGTDRFTKEQITVEGDRLTTQFPDDPSYAPGQGLVTQ